MWIEFLRTGADLLFRAWSTMKLTPIEVLPDGTWIAEIRKKSVQGGKARIPLDAIGDLDLATHIKVRVIEYHITGHRGTDTTSETFRIMTTILDPNDASAEDLAHAYHQRWEIETAFHEIECQLLSNAGLRSKTPDMVEQEFWGLLVSHYAIRAFTQEAADTVDMDPDRISFTRTLNIARRRVTDAAAFPPGAERTSREHACQEAVERLNTRRQRTYPRVSKKGNRHTFPTKQPSHQRQHYEPKTMVVRRAA